MKLILSGYHRLPERPGGTTCDTVIRRSAKTCFCDYIEQQVVASLLVGQTQRFSPTQYINYKVVEILFHHQQKKVKLKLDTPILLLFVYEILDALVN